MSDVFINASLPFYKCLCTLINIAIIHGYIPADWHAETIIPLLKSGNLDKSLLSSYRPITLSSLFGKVIDLMILNRHQEAFNSSDLQFGFKSSHSTNHCELTSPSFLKNYCNDPFLSQLCVFFFIYISILICVYYGMVLTPLIFVPPMASSKAVYYLSISF